MVTEVVRVAYNGQDERMVFNMAARNHDDQR